MAWTTPVTDWTATDYFNVADWERIHDNALHVNGLITSVLGYSISIVTISDPTTTTIIDTTWLYNLNTLIANINRMRAWLSQYYSDYLSDISDLLKEDWQAGLGVQSPNYATVNGWENTLLIMYNMLDTWSAQTISGNLDLGGGGSLELGGGGYLELGV